MSASPFQVHSVPMDTLSRSGVLFNERSFFAERTLNILIAAILFFGTLFALLQLERGFIIGHDESVYATKARQWVTGAPADQFEIYRPIGMPVATLAVYLFGESESHLRLFGILFGALLPTAVYALFRQMCNLWVALVIALVASTSYLFFEQAPRLLDDIPSSVLLLFTSAILYAHFKSGGTSRSIYLAPLLAASAFYLRYGSITSLLVMGIFSYLILLPKYLQFERQFFYKFGYSLILGAALLLPHFLYSLATTKSAFGVLQLAGKAAHRVYLGEGLVRYLELLPKGIGGWVLGSTALIGIFVVIVLIISPLREKYLGLTWTGCVGLGTFFLTGLLVHAEPRYVFFSMVLLSGTGISGVFYLVARNSRILANTLLGSLYAITCLFAVLHYREITSYFVTERNSTFNTSYKEALARVRSDAGTTPCIIWTGLDRPRASWYSQCETARDFDGSSVLATIRAHPDYAFYSVVGANERDPQLTASSSEAYGLLRQIIYEKTDVQSMGEIVAYRIY